MVSMLAIAAHLPAYAHNFCVITATDLQNTLTDAFDGGMFNGEDNMLVLGPGNFDTANNGGERFYFSSTAEHCLDSANTDRYHFSMPAGSATDVIGEVASTTPRLPRALRITR